MQKTVSIDGLDAPVTFIKRKGARAIRITIKSEGVVRVTVPYGVPEFVAKQFVKQKKSWISEHYRAQSIFTSGMRVGKNHTLRIVQGNSTRSRTVVSDTEILVIIKQTTDIASADAQATIKKACEKALIMEAERLIPQRVQVLSEQFGIPYKSCKIQKLKSRWGACDHQNNLSFNSYLMQLDWVLIDYVICHELAHTIHHHHQAPFWELVEKLYPKYKSARKVLKTKRTDVVPQDKTS